jgi:glutamine amidotransferase
MIGIIDYGMGNIHSVQKALETLGARTVVTNKAKEINACEKVVLPGVGAFDDAIAELRKHGLTETIEEYILSKKIFLGICLGMQLLFEDSQEARHSKGLGIVKGSVRKFAESKDLKIPHMGWNQVRVRRQDCPLLNDVQDNAYAYFCHSYYPEPVDKEVIAATTEYGIEFASIIWQQNVFGIQFHPEKSQEVGLKILKNFVNL